MFLKETERKDLPKKLYLYDSLWLLIELAFCIYLYA